MDKTYNEMLSDYRILKRQASENKKETDIDILMHKEQIRLIAELYKQLNEILANVNCTYINGIYTWKKKLL